ncbi:MAG: hypothetical protein WC552_03385 [Candidatus Omnitrophota bacterium]
MNRKSLSLLNFVFILSLLSAWGCGNPSRPRDAFPKDSSSEKTKDSFGEASAEKGEISEEPFKMFYVYTDKGSRGNHFNPSGFMPDGQCVKFDDKWRENCQAGKTCIRIIYDIECSEENQSWSGIYWLNPPNNWGTRKGGYNLVGAKKLTFWAKGEKGGEHIGEFKVGGIAGDFPDSDMAIIGPVILTNEWREYSIDLRGKDLSYISGGFSWATSVEANSEGCTFYLDEIKYE